MRERTNIPRCGSLGRAPILVVVVILLAGVR
jgi:hypothetical protein